MHALTMDYACNDSYRTAPILVSVSILGHTWWYQNHTNSVVSVLHLLL